MTWEDAYAFISMQAMLLMKIQQNNKDNVNQSEEFIKWKQKFAVNKDGSLTKIFLEARGYCCNNGCKHCPY